MMWTIVAVAVGLLLVELWYIPVTFAFRRRMADRWWVVLANTAAVAWWPVWFAVLYWSTHGKDDYDDSPAGGKC